MFQDPGHIVGNEDCIETSLKSGIHIRSRAVSDHPSHVIIKTVFFRNRVICGGVLFRYYFYGRKILLQTRTLDLGNLLRGGTLSHENQVVLAICEMQERFGNARNDLDRVLSNSEGKRVNPLPQLWSERLDA